MIYSKWAGRKEVLSFGKNAFEIPINVYLQVLIHSSL